MKRTRVEIGSVVVRGSGAASIDTASFGRMLQTHLEQLLRRQGAPTESRHAGVVRVQGSTSGRAASCGNAPAIANAIFRSLKGKA